MMRVLHKGPLNRNHAVQDVKQTGWGVPDRVNTGHLCGASLHRKKKER